MSAASPTLGWTLHAATLAIDTAAGCLVDVADGTVLATSRLETLAAARPSAAPR